MILTPFDNYDWDIWSGCEDPLPLKLEWEDNEGISIIIDGCDIIVCADTASSLSHISSEASYELFTFSSKGIAILAAMTLDGNENLKDIHIKLEMLVQK